MSKYSFRFILSVCIAVFTFFIVTDGIKIVNYHTPPSENPQISLPKIQKVSSKGRSVNWRKIIMNCYTQPWAVVEKLDGDQGLAAMACGKAIMMAKDNGVDIIILDKRNL